MKKLEWNWRVSVEQIKPGRKGQVLDLTLICGTQRNKLRVLTLLVDNKSWVLDYSSESVSLRWDGEQNNQVD